VAIVTFQCTLALDVVEELGVVGVHGPAARARHHLLLGVTPQVLSQLRTPLGTGLTLWTHKTITMYEIV